MDPATSDKAMGLLLKTNIVINKWASHEDDLKRMKIRRVLEVDRIEQGLDTLYFDSLVLMSSIYLAGRSRTGRFGKPDFPRILRDPFLSALCAFLASFFSVAIHFC